MELLFGQLENYLVVERCGGTKSNVYVQLKSRPKMYKGMTEPRREDKTLIQESLHREVSFRTCTSRVIGGSSVIALNIDNCNIDNLLHELELRRFKVLTAGVVTVEVAGNQEGYIAPQFDSFDSTFAMFSLSSRGFKVTDCLNSSFLKHLATVPDDLLPDVLHALAHAVDQNSLCPLEVALDKSLTDLSKNKRATEKTSKKKKTGNELPEHYVSVRRLVLTPTAVVGLPAVPIVENRVLRQYGADRFLRVALREEDFQKLNSWPFRYKNKQRHIEAIGEVLRNGIVIADRRYHFLACSNSQLREHGLYMYACDGQNTVDTIRSWMGDLTDERCVATYVSRLGQCFTSTTATLTIEPDSLTMVDDICNDKYCFTDGIGKISESLAKKVTFNTFNTSHKRMIVMMVVVKCFRFISLEIFVLIFVLIITN